MTDPNQGLLGGDDENRPDRGFIMALNAGPDYKRSPNWEVWASQLNFASERYEAGNPLSLLDGLALCRRGNMPIPDWLFQGLMDFGRAALFGDLPRRRGRSGSQMAYLRDVLIHQERFVAVWSTYDLLRTIKSGDPNAAEAARSMLGLEPDQEVKTTWISAYEIASDDLAGSFAQGNVEAMKRSYIKVAKWHKDGDERAYFMSTALPETFAALGLSTPRMGGYLGR